MRNPAKPYIFEKVRSTIALPGGRPIRGYPEIADRGHTRNTLRQRRKNVFRIRAMNASIASADDDRARGIIGIADKDQARLVSDGIRHIGQMMLPALEWNDDELACAAVTSIL